jgi:hypothetical protein
MEVSGQFHVPVAFPPGKRPLFPLVRRLGGPQSPAGDCGKGKVIPVLSLTEHYAMKVYWRSGV